MKIAIYYEMRENELAGSSTQEGQNLNCFAQER